MQGMGGLGKSVLAAALAWDEQVRRAFPDGIFWLRFGQEVDEAGVLELQKEILLMLAPSPHPKSPAQGRNLLNLALRDKRCLIIVDDLWDSRHLNHFDISDSESRSLLTTRNNEVIQETGAHRCELELLSVKQARELLAKCSGFTEEDLPEEAEAILRECNRLPLAVAAIGSMVNGKGRSRWQLALEKLRHARLDKIPTKFDRYSGYENLFKVFQVSVEDLPPEVQAYYKTLLVFPEDAAIPESVLQLYWEHGCPGDFEPLEAIDLLVRRSLLSPAGEEWFTLHDLYRDYLVILVDGKVAELHRQLLAAYQVAYPNGWHTIPYAENGYFYSKWILHAKTTDKLASAAIIADDLIRGQRQLNIVELTECLDIVDYNLNDIAKSLLNTSESAHVIIKCLKLLKSNAKSESRNLLKRHNHPDVLIECIKICSIHYKNDVYQFLIELCIFLHPSYSAKSKNIRFSEKYEYKYVLSFCLYILGISKKNEMIILTRRKNNKILEICLNILEIAAEKEARCLLKLSHDDQLRLACIRILGKESEADAQWLLGTTKSKTIREACQELIFSWKVGSKFSELDRLKKNLDDK